MSSKKKTSKRKTNKNKSINKSSYKTKKKDKSTKSTKSSIVKFDKVKITEFNVDRFINNYGLDIKPKLWDLPNRKSFYNWMFNMYKDFRIGNTMPKSKNGVELFRIQRLVKNFFQEENPNRGILLYHGLGLGKSGAAISIVQGMPNKDVIFLSKASLEPNFIFEIKKFGVEYMRTSHHWVFSNCKSKFERDLAKSFGIPLKIVDQNNGCFFIDYKKKTILTMIIYLPNISHY